LSAAAAICWTVVANGREHWLEFVCIPFSFCNATSTWLDIRRVSVGEFHVEALDINLLSLNGKGFLAGVRAVSFNVWPAG